MSASRDELEKAKIFLKLALKSDQIIQQASQRLNEKIRGVFAVASTLIPIVAGLGYFILRETRAYWILFPISVSLAMFLLAMILGIWLQRPTYYKYVDPRVIVQKYTKKGKSLQYIVNKWASTWSDTVNYNADSINAKENVLNYVFALMAIGLAILLVSFLVLAINMTNQP